MSTVRATFGRGIPLVDLDQVPAIPRCFVGQKGHKLTPTHVTDRLGQRVVFDHVLDCQTLDTDRLVFTNQTCRELVQEVATSLSNTSMDTSNLFTGFGSILAPLLFLGVSPLCFGQFLLIFIEELGVADGLASREDDELFQAQVSPDGLLYRLKLFDLLCYQERDKVAICTVFRNGDAAWCCPHRQGTAPTNVERLNHLCQGQE